MARRSVQVSPTRARPGGQNGADVGFLGRYLAPACAALCARLTRFNLCEWQVYADRNTLQNAEIMMFKAPVAP